MVNDYGQYGIQCMEIRACSGSQLEV